MNYHRNMIIATFRANHPTILTVTEARLQALDQDLFDTINDELESEATKAGIPINKFNLSMLVYFSELSKSAAPRKRAEAACKYFTSTMPVP